jgi:hypothetical protein
MGSSRGSFDEEAVSTTLALETLGQPHPGGFDARAIARRGDDTVGHSDDQVRLLPQRSPSPDVDRLTGTGLQSLKQVRQDHDIAFGILPDVVKGFGEKALEARAGGNHAQLFLIQSLRTRRQRSGRTTCCAWSRDEIK